MLSAAPELPKTAPASPHRSKQDYVELSWDGHEFVAIHISYKAGGTSSSASQGASATSSDCPIKVIDSGQASTGLGMAAVAAAELPMQAASR